MVESTHVHPIVTALFCSEIFPKRKAGLPSALSHRHQLLQDNNLSTPALPGIHLIEDFSSILLPFKFFHWYGTSPLHFTNAIHLN